MVYEPNSILARRENHPAGSDLEPFNRIRIVGPSPVVAPTVAEWTGSAGGDAVIVTPADTFGANEIIPQVILAAEYTIESVPEEEEPELSEKEQIKAIRNMPTPEQQFAELAQATPTQEKVTRSLKKAAAKVSD